MPQSRHADAREKHEGLPEGIPAGLRSKAEVFESRLGGRDQHLHDIGRLWSFGALNDIKFDVFALLQ